MNFKVKFLQVVQYVMLGAVMPKQEEHGQFVVARVERIKRQILPHFPSAQVSMTITGPLLVITGDEAGLKKNDNFIVEYTIKPDGVLKFKGSRDGTRS